MAESEFSTAIRSRNKFVNLGSFRGGYNGALGARLESKLYGTLIVFDYKIALQKYNNNVNG